MNRLRARVQHASHEPQQFVSGMELVAFTCDNVLDPAGNVLVGRIEAGIETNDKRAVNRERV
jgi:hypothetical protein